MKELYLIMNQCLKNKYGIQAIISVLETLEASYSEEEQIELKTLTYVIKTYLESLQEDMNTTIAKIDNYILAIAKNSKS